MSKPTLSEYKSNTTPIWCKGCGDYAVLSAIQKSLVANNIAPENAAVVSGIGCSSRLPDYINAYGFHGAHGRALPVATGLKLGSPDTHVITVGGDGDGLSIGVGHLVHAARRNPDITYILMDNSLYAMTKGQYSPTSKVGTVSGTSIQGSYEAPINPASFAISLGVSFVARATSADIKEMMHVISTAMEHKGFSFIHVVSPCVTFGCKDSYKAVKESSCRINDSHDCTNLFNAMELAMDTEKIHTGILFKQDRPVMSGALGRGGPVAMAQREQALEKSWQKFW